jgi:hypothetical protein
MIFWLGSSAERGEFGNSLARQTRNQKSADSPIRTVVSGGIGFADYLQPGLVSGGVLAAECL